MNGQLDPIALMRKIGELESKIEALRTIQTGGQWIPARIPVYVSTTSVRFVGINLTSVFPVGTKIKCTQTTVKYFYVIAAAYSGGDTTLTLTGGSDYTVADAAITEFAYSHAAVANGFPDWFNYVPTYGGSGSMTYTSVTTDYAKFKLDGILLLLKLICTGTTGGTASHSISATLPFERSVSTVHVLSASTIQYGETVYKTGQCFTVSSTTIHVRRPNSENWVLGASAKAAVSGTIGINF